MIGVDWVWWLYFLSERAFRVACVVAVAWLIREWFRRGWRSR